MTLAKHKFLQHYVGVFGLGFSLALVPTAVPSTLTHPECNARSDNLLECVFDW